jgi:hypothetical protein
MVTDLAAVLARQASPCAERLHALVALLRYGAAGETAIKDVFASHLAKTTNDIRLRAEIIRALYGRPYGAADIAALLNDSQTGEEPAGSGMFWNLADAIPAADLPAVLDGIVPAADDSKGLSRRGWDAGSFYARALVRARRAPGPFDLARALGWLRKRVAFKGGNYESRGRGLREAMRETPDRLTQLTQHFFRTVPLDGNEWLAWNRFREGLMSCSSARAI